MLEQLRATVGPGQQAACSESCSSRSEWETEEEQCAASQTTAMVVHRSGAAASPGRGPIPAASSYPSSRRLREQSFAEDTQRLHELFASGEPCDSQLEVEAPFDTALDGTHPHTMPREAACSPELVSDSEWRGAGALDVPELSPARAPSSELFATTASSLARLESQMLRDSPEAARAALPAAECSVVATTVRVVAHIWPLDHLSRAQPVVQSVTIPICPVGDEPRLRAQLSRCRAQLHAAQLEVKRTAGELSTTQHQLAQQDQKVKSPAFVSQERDANYMRRRMERLEVRLDSTHTPEEVHGKLNQLAEARLNELEEELQKKNQQVHQLQSATWGAWAQDMAVDAEIKRLQEELSQAHTTNVRLEKDLSKEKHGAAKAGEQAAAELFKTLKRAKEAEAQSHELGNKLKALEAAHDALSKEVRGFLTVHVRTDARIGVLRCGPHALARATRIENLQERERNLLVELDSRDESLRLAAAQKETLEEEMLWLRRGSSSAKLSTQYDEQLALLQQRSAAQAAEYAQDIPM
ncbi:hypothetical protein AB1Y20_016915 [Prymnesium parvum]|uniref:Centrosomal protein of 162 kDa n=1 Tax=Prymnesium parvum TaxID=97485 RepID=A0AB34ICN3_PRYPA